jgi:multidrug efflux pump subunit AcrB
VREAGASRFRPIVLISGSTFLGLAPLILERSVQAQFLVPMSVSLGFGCVASTTISLLVVPCLYLVLEDLKGWRKKASSSTPHIPQRELVERSFR